jgi:hypothetical protein
MTDITLGEMLTLLFEDLAGTLSKTDTEAGLRLQVSSLDLDLPTYLRLSRSGVSDPDAPSRLLLALPSTRESPLAGRVGRIALTLDIAAVPPESTPPETP